MTGLTDLMAEFNLRKYEILKNTAVCISSVCTAKAKVNFVNVLTVYELLINISWEWMLIAD